MAATDWYDRSVELFKAGQYNAALDASNNAIALDPNYALAWNSKGAALVNLGRYDEALVASNKAIELDPNLAKAWNNKGLALDHLGRYEEALAAFNRAGEVDPAYTLSDVYRNILIKKISSTNNSQPPSSIPQTGSIYFTSSPFGASVYVDGSYKGTTPTTVFDQTTGSHTIKISQTG